MSGWLGVIDASLPAAVVWGCWPPSTSLATGSPRRPDASSVASGFAGVSGWVPSAGSLPWRFRVLVLGGVVSVVCAAGLATAPVPTVVAALGTGAVLRSRRRRASQRTRAGEVAALPESLELCQVTLGAGGTVFDCLRVLAAHGPEPVRSAAQDGVRVASDGSRLDTALRSFQESLGLPFQPLTGALLLGWRQGGSIGLLLQRLTIEANASRRRLGELRARRLPVQLLAPLILFALPAVVIGAVVPIIVVAVRQLEL